jgi:hypothetical protein
MRSLHYRPAAKVAAIKAIGDVAPLPRVKLAQSPDDFGGDRKAAGAVP